MSLALAHDPGGKIRTALPVGMTGWAKFSDCGKYRKSLGRDWQPPLTTRPGYALIISMNPSTAAHDVNDPTLTRDIGFTTSWGLASLVKCNVGDYRATFPSELSRPGVVPCSAENDAEILFYAKGAAIVVMAHGVLPKPLVSHAKRITEALIDAGIDLQCLGTTKEGWPRHPLYLPKTAALMPYRPNVSLFSVAAKPGGHQ